jgi:hypothetical protein
LRAAFGLPVMWQRMLLLGSDLQRLELPLCTSVLRLRRTDRKFAPG